MLYDVQMYRRGIPDMTNPSTVGSGLIWGRNVSVYGGSRVLWGCSGVLNLGYSAY